MKVGISASCRKTALVDASITSDDCSVVMTTPIRRLSSIFHGFGLSDQLLGFPFAGQLVIPTNSIVMCSTA